MRQSIRIATTIFSLAWISCGIAHSQDATREISVLQYPSIQQAIDANPGRMIYVPSGDYRISSALVIRTNDTGLYGPGRIIQTNLQEPIIKLEHVSGIQLRDLTLTNEKKMTAGASAVSAIECSDLCLENLRVLDNSCPDRGSIAIRGCSDTQIRHCLVRNYKSISVDDRTANPHYGYAFNCSDGTGIRAERSRGLLIEGNRIIETLLLPTPEVAQKYNLGRFTKKNAQKGDLVSQEWWDTETVKNWPQGAAIQVTSPEVMDCVQIIGNYVENAEQGFDIHADHVIVAQNITYNTCLGMKALHGARNVLVADNQFVKADINGVLMQPGAASHAAGKPVHDEDPATSPANVDGGSIVANNIISDFGYGSSNWIWGNERWPLEFNAGQTSSNPPLRDVIVTGNLLYDDGRDGLLIDGQPKVMPPRYKYALFLSTEDTGPKDLLISNNILHPGTGGISNVEIKP